MARVQKSLKAPEQGYPHREHRSKNGRKNVSPFDKKVRRKLKRLKEQRKVREGDPYVYHRKGKWIA